MGASLRAASVVDVLDVAPGPTFFLDVRVERGQEGVEELFRARVGGVEILLDDLLPVFNDRKEGTIIEPS